MTNAGEPDRTGRDGDQAPTPPGVVSSAAFVVYGVVAGFAYVWLAWRQRTGIIAQWAVGEHGALWAFAVGSATAFALFAAVSLLTRYAAPFARLDARLVSILGPMRDRDAITLSLLSGAAEEFFFRCAALDAMGSIASTILFALCHFGGRRLWLASLQAAVFGGVFAGLVCAGFGVLAAALAHALFNYLWLQRLVPR